MACEHSRDQPVVRAPLAGRNWSDDEVALWASSNLDGDVARSAYTLYPDDNSGTLVRDACSTTPRRDRVVSQVSGSLLGGYASRS